jgi:HAD superfamily hydrolase (TIGR01549 family)
MLEAGERLMGFGHRVYRVRDPRAAVRSAAAERFYEADGEAAFYRTAERLESVAVDRNVDFADQPHTKDVPGNDYDAVLFDSDGVLVEPPARETQLEAVRAAFRAVGVENVARQHLVDLVSGVTVERLREVATAYDLPPDELWDARERHDELSQLDAFRTGARDRYDDVAAIAELPDVRGVVSNNHHSTIEFKLEFFELRSLFDTFYGREMTVESLSLKKPNTHYLDRAMADLGAASALYVGDSESDVVAAHRAGLDSAFVRRSHCRDVDLPVAPTYEVETLRDLPAIVG